MTNPPLTTLGDRIKAHLKEHRPTLAKQLEAAETLDQTSASLQDLADVAYDEARNSGLSPDQAREVARDVWALPDEETRRTSDTLARLALGPGVREQP